VISTTFPLALRATLAGILDIVADAVIAVDAEQRIVFFNQGAEIIFDWPASAMLGRSLDVLLPPHLIAVHRRHMQAFAQGPDEARLIGERQEIFGRRRDGREFPAEASIARLRAEGGLYFMVFLRDITERREQEAELRAGRRQLQALSRRLVEAQEAERLSIARELHDETGQALTALQFGLAALEQKTAAAPEILAEIQGLKQQIDAIQVGLHRLAMNLRPASLDRLGLLPALEAFVQSFGGQSGLAVHFVTARLPQCRLSSAAETALYRIAQEALTNVARHAEASEVSVILEQQAGTIVLIVEDNGVGFDVNQAAGRDALGLAGIRERAEMLGGQVTLESRPGAGTSMFVRVPSCDQPARA
jgi:PAS domain S-box-containing protein